MEKPKLGRRKLSIAADGPPEPILHADQSEFLFHYK